jgi:hypothetical protein
MTWTLWQGNDLLGTLSERPSRTWTPPTRPGTRHVNAVLVAVPERTSLPSVRQSVIELAGRHEVMERVLEPDIAGARPADTETGRAEAFWVVPSGPPLPRPDFPDERRLRVRDDANRIVPTRYVAVREYRLDALRLPTEVATFPAGALIDGSIWLVSFMEDADVPVA